jgi:hypothetical protein
MNQNLSFAGKRVKTSRRRPRSNTPEAVAATVSPGGAVSPAEGHESPSAATASAQPNYLAALAEFNAGPANLMEETSPDHSSEDDPEPLEGIRRTLTQLEQQLQAVDSKTDLALATLATMTTLLKRKSDKVEPKEFKGADVKASLAMKKKKSEAHCRSCGIMGRRNNRGSRNGRGSSSISSSSSALALLEWRGNVTHVHRNGVAHVLRGVGSTHRAFGGHCHGHELNQAEPVCLKG